MITGASLDPLRLYSLEMKNYRQFIDTKLEFSQDEKRTFTIYQGRNSAGKTNIMNAISWCLYRKEPHLREEEKAFPIINSKSLAKLSVGKIITMSVTLVLADPKGPKYKVERTLRGYRKSSDDKVIQTPYGRCYQGVEPSEIRKFWVLNRNTGGWDEKPDVEFDLAVARLLPQELSSFFFFDGEHLSSFFRKTEENVKDGIEKVSQLTIIDNAIKHLTEMKRQFNKQSSVLNSEAGRLVAEIEQLEKEFLPPVKEEHGRKIEELKPIRTRIEELKDQLRRYPVALINEYQRKKDELEAQIKQLNEELRSVEKERLELILFWGPQVILFDSVTTSLEVMKKATEEGIIPPPVEMGFLTRLLEEGKCLCGGDISESNPNARDKVRTLLSRVKFSPIVSFTARGDVILRDIKENMQNNTKKLDELRTKIRELEYKIDQLEKARLGISESLKNNPLEKVQAMATELDQKEAEERAINSRIAVLISDITRAENRIKELEGKLRIERKKDERQQYWQMKIDACERTLQTLISLRAELLEEVREQVRSKTESYFKTLVYRSDIYDRIGIDSEYRISVKHKRGYEVFGGLSAGETLLLALSFMAALREVTGFQFPILIDTPLGRVSGEERLKVAERIPLYLTNTQMTLLVTDTEYSSPIKDERTGKIIGSVQEKIKQARRIWKEFKLIIGDEETKVMPYE